jgi:hypothetical protein
MKVFRRRLAFAFAPRPETMADKMVRQVTGWVLALATFVFVPGCASDVQSQQATAYSVATGFLNLCDDSDYDHALEHFAKPLKASPTGATWIKEMQAHRDPYGIPVIRSLVSRDTQKLTRTATEPAKISYSFRTSFVGTTPGDESVSVEKFNGKWQVYDYKFRPSGKPPAEVKAANELRKANIENGNIKKPSEERNAYDRQY